MTAPFPCPDCERPIFTGPSRAGVVIQLDATPGTVAAYCFEVDGGLVEARTNDEAKKAKGKNFYRAHACTRGR